MCVCVLSWVTPSHNLQDPTSKSLSAPCYTALHVLYPHLRPHSTVRGGGNHIRPGERKPGSRSPHCHASRKRERERERIIPLVVFFPLLTFALVVRSVSLWIYLEVSRSVCVCFFSRYLFIYLHLSDSVYNWLCDYVVYDLLNCDHVWIRLCLLQVKDRPPNNDS